MNKEQTVKDSEDLPLSTLQICFPAEQGIKTTIGSKLELDSPTYFARDSTLELF